jgi:PTH1 family peptidyl-tRNA hydrolase
MKIIFGLGNPGADYVGTRHNTGFFFLDEIQAKYGFPAFKEEKKFNAAVSEGKRGKEKILLAKPLTFMNLSGKAVNALMNFYKLKPEDILVIHDDIDIAIGKIKIARNSSSAGHNGAQNIFDALGTQKIKRIRVGVKPEKKETETTDREKKAGDLVLKKFTPDELEKLEKTKEDFFQKTENLLTESSA